MDFGIFGFSPEQAQEFRNFMANQHQGASQGGVFGARAEANASATTPGGTAAAAEQASSQQGSGDFRDSAAAQGPGGNGEQQGGNSDEPPVLMHNASHNGVVCDVCNSEIRGFRYKCMQCPDYDLCAKCEHKGHHAGHIMMRIAFPEQSRSAIRRFMANASPSPPDSPPHHGHPHHPHHHRGGPRHGGHHGHGPYGFGTHPFFGLGGRRGGCHRRGGERESENEEENNEQRPATAPGCPYVMGKKEFKRWSKWMKRAAAHQHRSAEAYARAAAAGGPGAAAGGAAAAAGPDNAAEGALPMDFAAVASQIQEFLNYWGVPVDVVELYDQFGNRGQPAAGAEAGSAQNQAAGQQNAGAGTTPAEGGNNDTQETQPASPATDNITENMEQMRLDANANSTAAPAGAEQQQRQEEGLLMDLDTENSGWTLINNQSREQSPGNSVSPTAPPAAATTAAAAPVTQESVPVVTTPPSSGPSSASGSTVFGSAASNNGNAVPPTSPSAPPSFPAGLPNVPLYPVLNQPQIQQILQGVSNAVGNVVRSIPIVTDPRGPMGTTTTSATPQQPRPATGQPEPTPEMDARSMKTLNQLLAMGFSNEGGYLTRLVVAKKGDLEAVLSSLFPN